MGDPPGEALLAQAPDQFGKLGLCQTRHEVRNSLPFTAHAHVKRSVEAKRETQLRRGELYRREAEIESYSSDRIGSHWREQSLHLPKTALKDLEAPAVTPGELATAAGRARITINTKHTTPGCGEQRLAVTAAAERPVDINGIVTRRQSADHGIEKNWNVRWGRGDLWRRGPAPRCCQ